MELNIGGLVCDNTECDWEDMTIKLEDYGQYVNMPCPKCGENVLTEEDYKGVVDMVNAVEMANTMSPNQLEEMLKNLTPEQMDEALDKMNEMGFEKVKDNGDGTGTWVSKHDKHKNK